MAHNTNPPLPSSVIGRMEIGKLVFELQNLEDSFNQLKLRQPGEEVKMLKASPLLNIVATYYKLNLLHQADRNSLINFLQINHDKAPLMHISFSADPPPLFLEKLVTWLRHNIHPRLLLNIGLQPAIGAGCIIRTTNRFFDLSLKQDFINKRPQLIKTLSQINTTTPAIEKQEGV